MSRSPTDRLAEAIWRAITRPVTNTWADIYPQYKRPWREAARQVQEDVGQ